jgi:hypothetical protein
VRINARELVLMVPVSTSITWSLWTVSLILPLHSVLVSATEACMILRTSLSAGSLALLSRVFSGRNR